LHLVDGFAPPLTPLFISFPTLPPSQHQRLIPQVYAPQFPPLEKGDKEGEVSKYFYTFGVACLLKLCYALKNSHAKRKQHR
jgi:hypothetical protein